MKKDKPYKNVSRAELENRLFILENFIVNNYTLLSESVRSRYKHCFDRSNSYILFKESVVKKYKQRADKLKSIKDNLETINNRIHEQRKGIEQDDCIITVPLVLKAHLNALQDGYDVHTDVKPDINSFRKDIESNIDQISNKLSRKLSLLSELEDIIVDILIDQLKKEEPDYFPAGNDEFD